jgi:hypothetical protein
MSSQKKSRKGSGKVKNLEPRKAARRDSKSVKGGYGTTGVISTAPLQTVSDVATSYDMLSKLEKDLYASQQQTISNLKG